MNFKFSSSIVLIFFLIVSSGCINSKKDMQPGIILSFDDRNMLHWEQHIPLFDKYDAHVTFFVDNFDKLTAEQLEALKRLKNAGHAIGCHGLRHRKAAEYSEQYSLKKYISDEIEPAISLMNNKGFFPTSFAYPSSNRNHETDNELLKYFRHLRSGGLVEEEIIMTERLFVKVEEIQNKGRIDGVSFHPKSRTDKIFDQVKDAIDRISKNGELLFLYAHDIRNENEDGPKHYITIEALEEILLYSKNNNIKLYSFDELP